MTELIEDAQNEIVNKLIDASVKSTLHATEDIYDRAGNKLLSKGYVITRNIQNKLMEKALKKPIETSVNSDSPVTSQDIANRAQILIKNSSLLSALIRDDEKEIKALSLIDIKPLASTLLTLMRDGDRDMFNHAIFVTLVARSIAQKMQLHIADINDLTISGLLHDVGELYLSFPKVGVLTKSNWRKVMLHPKLGSTIVKREMQYSDLVADAILEHHERADCTGYPNRKHADECSMNGQILILAEAVSGILKTGVDAQHISVVMKAQQDIYPSKPFDSLMQILKSLSYTRAEVDKHAALDRLRLKVTTIDAAEAKLILLQDDAEIPVVVRGVAKYMRTRVHKLKQKVYASGLHYHLEDVSWMQADGDHFLMLELEVLTSELGWQIQDLLRDVTLKLVDFKETLPVQFAEVTEQLAKIYEKRNARTTKSR